jgi:FkbM family methyltransferase
MSLVAAANNQLRRVLRPLVHSFRDIKRVTQVDEDIKRVLPKLYEYKFSEKDIAIDLGANRGDFSVWISNKECFVIGFEPHPEAFEYFSKRVGSNKRILRIQASISNQSHIGQVYVHPDAQQDQLGFSIRSSIKPEKEGFIPYSPTYSLDFLHLVNAIDDITVLKVDIEGSEIEIWQEIKRNYKKIKFLLIEVHDSMNPKLRSEIDTFIEQKVLFDTWTANWV